MHYYGQMALQTAILVAFTQLIPEHQVHVFGVIKARVKVGVARMLARLLFDLRFTIAFTHGLRRSLEHHVCIGMANAMDSHPVRMAGVLDISTILQAQHW